MTALLDQAPPAVELLPRLMEAVRTTGTDVADRAAAGADGRDHRAEAPTVTGRHGDGPVVRGPEDDTAPTRPLDTVLRERRSLRFFDDRSVDLTALTTCLARSAHADARLWSAPEDTGTAPQVILAALRVDGLAPGLYRFDPTPRTYTWLAPLTQQQVADMVLQTEFGEAAVVVAAMGSLATALASLGDHGQRLLNVRAAGLCYAALLEANARGITGSVFAGFLPSGISRLVNADGFHLAQVFAVSLGHQAPAHQTSDG